MHNHDTEIAAAVEDIHGLYGQLTGQQLTLRYDRQRLWFEFLRAGFGPQELQRVVRYLQKEIRAGRRNVGALVRCGAARSSGVEDPGQSEPLTG
jgi:hypothetical protein